jgi:cell division protein FtsW
MAKLVGVDKWLFFTTLLLVVAGLVMVFSASAVVAQERFHSPYTFVGKQAIWALAGVLTMLVLMHVDYSVYKSPRFIYPALCVTTLLLVLVFFFPDSHNTHRWIRFGGFFTFQPSEIAKPVVVLFLAWFLSTRLDAMRDWKNTLLRAVIMPVVFILLIVKQPDLGTALVLLGVTAMMLLLAGMEWKYFFFGALAALPGLAALLFMVAWRRQRMLVFLNPESDPQGAGFHINQSLIAVGTGGLTGRGYMEGMQKLFYLPEAHTDFIFANIAEELGFIGCHLLRSALCGASACAACARPFVPRIPLPAWLLSALPLPSCCRPSSTSAWSCRWCPPREFRCR